ncbi:unnamed protein product [Symbiodinium sp. CCMP2592]|nr:unnamed protein product [Symbiodinium sp. CCMP2592]
MHRAPRRWSSPLVSCCLTQVAVGRGSSWSAAVCHLKVMPLLGRIVPRKPRKAPSLVLKVPSRPCTRPSKRSCAFLRQDGPSLLRTLPRTVGLALASVASSRTRPAPPPSKYFLPFLKRDQKTTVKRLHIADNCHDVRHLLDAMLAGSRPSFIPASGQAPSREQVSKFRCQRFGSCPMTARRISKVSPPG